METGKNTSADRNRKQTGNSEEIVADSAICTCDKGSKPGTFRVTSRRFTVTAQENLLLQIRTKISSH